MYGKFKTWKRHHQVLFGLLLGVGVISLWRGIWGLSDIFLFPGNSVMSYIASVVIGIIIISAAHYAIEGRE